MKKGSRVPLSPCTSCGHKMDAATSAQNDGAIPSPGDVTVCINCGAMNQYADDMQLKSLTVFELELLKAQNPEGYQLLKKEATFADRVLCPQSSRLRFILDFNALLAIGNKRRTL